MPDAVGRKRPPSRLDKRGGRRPAGTSPLPWPILLLLLVATWAGIFAVRYYGPPDIFDNDQQRPAAYALDVLVNGNWIVQRDDSGDITSKPPLYTWILVLTAKAVGEFNEFSLYLPGALALLGCSLIIFHIGRRPFGDVAAFIGAAGCLLATSGFKQVHLARTDAVFSFFVLVSAWGLFRAARGEWSWWVFWLAAAAGTMTKGPLVLLLAAGGLFGLLGGRKSDDEAMEAEPFPWRIFLAGAVVYIVICLGWFLLAWAVGGNAVVDKIIGKELIGHAIESGKGRKPFDLIYIPPLYFLSRFLPWSVFALVAIVRLFARPARSGAARALERFLAGYFLLGLLIFSIVPHQRWDHQFPLLPAAALLAGREITRWFSDASMRRLVYVYPGVVAVVLGIVAAVIHTSKDRMTRRSELARDAAASIERRVGDPFVLMHADATMGFQFYLGTMRQRITPEQGREALYSDEAAFVVVHEKDDFKRMLPDGMAGLYFIERWIEPGRDEPFMRLISNRPELRWYPEMVFYLDGLRVSLHDVVATRVSDTQITGSKSGPNPSIRIVNKSDDVRRMAIVLHTDSRTIEEKWKLNPGEVEETAP